MSLTEKVREQHQKLRETNQNVRGFLKDSAELTSSELVYGAISGMGILQELIRQNLAKFPPEGRTKDRGMEGYSKNPIILLHGYGENRGAYVDMEDRLRFNGFEVIHRLNYDFFDPIEETSEGKLLERNIQIIQQSKCKSGKADLIGFSQGGLLARYFAQHHPELVDHCVMVGAPNDGTYMAILGYYAIIGDMIRLLGLGKGESHVGKIGQTYHVSLASAKQMMKNSDFIRELNSYSKSNGHSNTVKYINIYSRADEALLSVSRVEGALNLEVGSLGIRNVGHMGLVHHWEVIDRTAKFLSEALNGQWDMLVKMNKKELRGYMQKFYEPTHPHHTSI
ncbi:MAG TPA: alpha/beta fold hydrolase [Candidatus Nanoarchaeia archaeon]|nr:alpha/beta fold hydrolase [Candidatus Nanoarchaeia archaeon]